ncbi:hypothetical protein RFI_04089, partial [Reticulomyxa filosa]
FCLFVFSLKKMKNSLFGDMLIGGKIKQYWKFFLFLFCIFYLRGKNEDEKGLVKKCGKKMKIKGGENEDKGWEKRMKKVLQNFYLRKRKKLKKE